MCACRALLERDAASMPMFRFWCQRVHLLSCACPAGLTTTKRASVRLIRHHAGGKPRHIELRVPNTRRKYSAGQWVFLCVPRLGLLHWHPFTISSSGFDKDVTLHFTCGGRWTSKVAALAEQESTIKVRCRGGLSASERGCVDIRIHT